MDPKNLQIWIAVIVGVLSLLTTSVVCIRQIGKLIAKVNSASKKVDELKTMLWTPEGKQRFVDTSDCKLHRESIETMIGRSVEMATLKMTKQIEQDFKSTISRLHDKIDEVLQKK